MKIASLIELQQRAKRSLRSVLSLAPDEPTRSLTATSHVMAPAAALPADTPLETSPHEPASPASSAGGPVRAIPQRDAAAFHALHVAEDDGWPARVSRR